MQKYVRKNPPGYTDTRDICLDAATLAGPGAGI